MLTACHVALDAAAVVIIIIDVPVAVDPAAASFLDSIGNKLKFALIYF